MMINLLNVPIIVSAKEKQKLHSFDPHVGIAVNRHISYSPVKMRETRRTTEPVSEEEEEGRRVRRNKRRYPA